MKPFDQQYRYTSAHQKCKSVSPDNSRSPSSMSSEIWPCTTRSRWPVSICQTYVVPSEHPTTIKSSKGRHLIVWIGKICLDASKTHFFSLRDNRATEWALDTLQIHCWILGLQEAGGTYKLVISPDWLQNRCNSVPEYMSHKHTEKSTDPEMRWATSYL